MNNSDYTYIFSSFDVLPDRFFQGYCFVNNDLVIGEEGARNYPEEIPPFSDGCYISINKEEDTHTIGVDSNGFKKIFLYNKNGVWAISNSIYLLAKYLYGKGVKLTRNYPVLAAFFRHGNVGNQMATLKTVFNEISLFPHEAYITVRNGVISIEKKEISKDLGYQNNLNVYIETWVSRIETIIESSSTKAITDLTGGIDSRTTYSLFKAALDRLNLDRSDSLFIRSDNTPKNYIDLQCAKNIVNRYKGELNQPAKLQITKYNGSYAYEKWKNLNLGNYFPIYIPRNNMPNNAIFFGGGAGEVHRSVYGNRNPKAFSMNLKKRIEDKYELHTSKNLSDLLELYSNQLVDSVEELKRYSPEDRVNPLVLHYREFRNRFHAGRSPQYGQTIAPLGSDLLTVCSTYCDKDVLDRGQILYDIMESLCPGLAMMPYDMELKFPSYEAIKNICLIPVREKSNPGQVYKKKLESVDKVMNDGLTVSPLVYLKEELDDFINNYDNEFFTNDFINDASDFLAKSVQNDNFTHAADAAPVSQILTYKMMLDFSC